MTTAKDGFQKYYSEKLWEMIPAIYRHEDGLAEPPGALRALVEILAEQAAILRRSQDRLWEDQFIELCDAWAVPYISDLVATRLVSILNPRGRKVDVAKTIYYRRRKGTPAILEELVSDIADWDGKLVEMFTRLARTRHALDPQPLELAGRFSGTLPGGWADLRDPRAAERTGGPFEEYFHTPDFRQARGKDGRYNLPKLVFFLYRLERFKVAGVTPFPIGNDGLRFTMDPSGRDIPLYQWPQHSKEWKNWRSAKEWEVAAPISCRLLEHAEYKVSKALIATILPTISTADANVLSGLTGVLFPSESRLREILAFLCQQPKVVGDAIVANGLVQDCGKAVLTSSSVSVEVAPGSGVAAKDLTAGDLSGWPLADPGKRVVIDPERGRFEVFGSAPAAGSGATYCYGFSGKVGAGTYNRSLGATLTPTILPNIDASNSGGTILANRLANQGIAQIDDNTTYRGIGNLTAIQDFTLQAADQKRPYIRLKANWVLGATPTADALLTLDGLWLGAEGNYGVVLKGDFDRITFSHCSFDPGGAKDAAGQKIHPVPLIIVAKVKTLTIESSILGRIYTKAGGGIEQLVIRDSILDALEDGQTALQLPEGTVKLDRVTVFGQVDVERLWASEALITGKADVTDTQAGCFRFSAAPTGSRLPRAYESFSLADVRSIFTDRRFGQPGYAQLSQMAPTGLTNGAEDGSEVGAFSGLRNPIKLDGLNAKIEEYMPFGLVPVYSPET